MREGLSSHHSFVCVCCFGKLVCHSLVMLVLVVFLKDSFQGQVRTLVLLLVVDSKVLILVPWSMADDINIRVCVLNRHSFCLKTNIVV